MTENQNRRPLPLRIGLLTLDSVNEQFAHDVAAQSGDVVIPAPKVEMLERAGVDVIVYDIDHLHAFGDPLKLVMTESPRPQVAFSYNLIGDDAKALRRRGVIVCRRLPAAMRRAVRVLRQTAAPIA